MKHKLIILWVTLGFGFIPPLVFGADATQPPSNAKSGMSQPQKLQTFDSINISGIGHLYITQSNEESFTVEADETVLPLIQVYVKDKVLYLDLKDSSKHLQAKINYYLNVKNIQSINSFDASDIIIKNGLSADTLNLTINSLGEAHLNLKVKQLVAKIGGGGKVELLGTADQQDITIVGAGEFNGSKLTGKTGSINIKESGVAKINVSDTLAISINGDGTVQYCNKPSITKQVSGKNIINPLDSKEC